MNVRAFLVLLCTVSVVALRAQTAVGAIEGRVFNAATGVTLGNARVLLEGTSRETVTEADGSYRIVGVPAGVARLSVAYVGL